MPAPDPLSLLRLFSQWLGLATEMADMYADKHPEVIRAYTAGAPLPAPDEDIDPEVAERIERGEV